MNRFACALAALLIAAPALAAPRPRPLVLDATPIPLSA